MITYTIDLNLLFVVKIMFACKKIYMQVIVIKIYCMHCQALVEIFFLVCFYENILT